MPVLVLARPGDLSKLRGRRRLRDDGGVPQRDQDRAPPAGHLERQPGLLHHGALAAGRGADQRHGRHLGHRAGHGGLRHGALRALVSGRGDLAAERRHGDRGLAAAGPRAPRAAGARVRGAGKLRLHLGWHGFHADRAPDQQGWRGLLQARRPARGGGRCVDVPLRDRRGGRRDLCLGDLPGLARELLSGGRLLHRRRGALRSGARRQAPLPAPRGVRQQHEDAADAGGDHRRGPPGARALAHASARGGAAGGPEGRLAVVARAVAAELARHRSAGGRLRAAAGCDLQRRLPADEDRVAPGLAAEGAPLAPRRGPPDAPDGGSRGRGSRVGALRRRLGRVPLRGLAQGGDAGPLPQGDLHLHLPRPRAGGQKTSRLRVPGRQGAADQRPVPPAPRRAAGAPAGDGAEGVQAWRPSVRRCQRGRVLRAQPRRQGQLHDLRGLPPGHELPAYGGLPAAGAVIRRRRAPLHRPQPRGRPQELGGPPGAIPRQAHVLRVERGGPALGGLLGRGRQARPARAAAVGRVRREDGLRGPVHARPEPAAAARGWRPPRRWRNRYGARGAARGRHRGGREHHAARDNPNTA
mmetsp:Transcript_70491/g.206729  ORF Transcript_70491/g.206729 Transcript_70491/m.206729 type:complete len:582 (+) Transcript_70491:950-2695(+)